MQKDFALDLNIMEMSGGYQEKKMTLIPKIFFTTLPPKKVLHKG